jgi:hypothetical protein
MRSVGEVAFAPTIQSDVGARADSSGCPPTLRSYEGRGWREATADLEVELVRMYDAARTLPPGPVIALLAELRRYRDAGNEKSAGVVQGNSTTPAR